MALLTYDWHPPDPTGAVNAYLSGMKAGLAQQEAAAREREVAQKLAADALERQRLTKRFEEQHALQLQQEARLAGAEQLRQGYHAAAAQQKAADILATKTAAESIIGQFSNPTLPTGGVTSPAPPVSAAQSIVTPDASDPLIGQPPPVAVDGATMDGPPANPNAALVSPAEMIALGKAGKLDKPTSAPISADFVPRAAGGLPATAGPTPASQLLAPTDGFTPAPRPARGAPVPDAAALLRALPPKDVIAVARGAAQAQLRDSLKPAATPKPDPLRTLPDGSLARVGADNKPVVIATKPPPVVTPQQEATMLNTERDNATGDAKRFQSQLGALIKDKKPVDLGYAWNPAGTDKWYRMGDPRPISKEQAAAQNVVAQQVADLKTRIEAAEKKAQAIDARGGARAPDATPAAATPTDDKVSVVSPDGKRGRIPRSQLQEALKAGYKAAQ